MFKSIGIQKLKQAMEEHGYIKVSTNIGVGQSILYQWIKGEKKPTEMKMKTAVKLKKVYGIEFEDWEKKVDLPNSPILDK